ncbi:MAG TPA: YjfB family protein [Termitinemataceae bacterium]|nr:YjfB family protein [Termitinemataceae bacterium]HOM23240.1 YjfB family protein [Termitinemataceae bacterium]HPQ00213.1 YjfB family protein [Termitinemataceae bacterium]
MDIQKLSMDMAQGHLSEQVGMAVLRMALGKGNEQAQALGTLLESASPAVIQDPQLGTTIDILA